MRRSKLVALAQTAHRRGEVTTEANKRDGNKKTARDFHG